MWKEFLPHNRMTATRYSPVLAFSCLLVLLIAGSLVVQAIGHVLGVNASRAAFFIVLPFAVWLVYVRCFPWDAKYIAVAFLLALLLADLGIACRHWYDFTADGMGYQQPTAQALLQGWNPLGPEPELLWQQIYPWGAAGAEASLAGLYGSIESARILQIWWLVAALPIFLCGIACNAASLSRIQLILAVLCVLSATVTAQLLTHYVDSLIYLSGMTFLGALLMYVHAVYGRMMPAILMTACVVFVVNAKLSGIYHAFMLCVVAVTFAWIKTRQFSWKLAFLLLLSGLAAVLFVGYRSYVTNFMHYGLAMFPDDTDAFSGTQRPSSFDTIPAFARFFYSLFSITGGFPHEPAQLKWPWELHKLEWEFAGIPDARAGGFGPLFALCFLLSLGIFVYAVIRKIPIDKGLAALGGICLLFSALFPQGWWARYVPFAYCAPFFLLLSIPSFGGKIMRNGMYALIVLFAVNITLIFSSAFVLSRSDQIHFLEVAAKLRGQPAGSVYLVPPTTSYRKYNHAYMPLLRRLKEHGVEATLKVDAPCTRFAEIYAEYKLCY